ncbi:MAG TPA: hypothetical protein VE843_14235, partial [Ktedonobacteraceae bacterium]|nr:hypothetical protein [Ktedonobacteraceae bacterium]
LLSRFLRLIARQVIALCLLLLLQPGGGRVPIHSPGMIARGRGQGLPSSSPGRGCPVPTIHEGSGCQACVALS